MFCSTGVRHLPTLALFVIGLCYACAADQVAAQPLPTTDLRAAQSELDQQWHTLQTNPGVGIRGVFRFAVEAAAVGYNRDRVDHALALARKAQDLDSTSKTYGNFKWVLDAPTVLDLNAVEFCMQQTAFLAKFQTDHLSDHGRVLLDQLMRTSIEGIKRHKVRPEYTNIYVMRCWNMIWLGETLHDSELASQGYRDFTTWLAYTAKNGLSEYISPNYYGTVLDSLAPMSKYIEREEGRQQAEAALRYVWTDISAHWFAPGERLGGAHGRNYDYLLGRGYLDAHLIKAGWLSWKPEIEEAGWVSHPAREQLIYVLEGSRWDPPEALTEPIRTQIPRMVYQRCGATADFRASDYVARTFALGSAGVNHGQEDHSLVMYWPGDHDTVQSDFLLEGRNDPYGLKKARHGAHSKALHLEPFVATVQNGPEVLQVLSTDLSAKSKVDLSEITGLYAQFVLPRGAEVWQNGTKWMVGTDARPTALKPNLPVFVRFHGVTVGVRYVLISSPNEQAVTLTYVHDVDIPSADRLTLTLSSTKPTARGSVTVLMRAQEDSDEKGFATFAQALATTSVEQQLQNGMLKLKVAGVSSPLEIEADLDHEKRVRLSGFAARADCLISVNGKDYGKDVLQLK